VNSTNIKREARATMFFRSALRIVQLLKFINTAFGVAGLGSFHRLVLIHSGLLVLVVNLVVRRQLALVEHCFQILADAQNLLLGPSDLCFGCGSILGDHGASALGTSAICVELVVANAQGENAFVDAEARRIEFEALQKKV